MRAPRCLWSLQRYSGLLLTYLCGGLAEHRLPRGRVLSAISVALLAGMDAAGEYPVMLLSNTDSSFNQVDPVFKTDLSFFVFELPLVLGGVELLSCWP